MPVSSLSLTKIGPFDEIKFEFDSQVNVFTGPNNSGKSSALWALGDITVFPFSFPDKLLRVKDTATFAAHILGYSNETFKGELPVVRRESQNGHVGYWTQSRWNDHVEVLKTIGYSKFIPALRRSTDFRSPGPVAMSRDDTNSELQLNQDYWDTVRYNIDRQRLTRRRLHEEQDDELKKRLTLVSEDASLVSDLDVIQSIVELDYRSYLRQQPESRGILVKLGQIASEITEGYPITFIGVTEDSRGFFPEFETIDGVMPINTLSQGTQSIIQWLTHLLIGYAEYYDFPEDLEEKQGILIVDEIDAHLHPSWQRRIIPTLTNHFPNLQIFCSTHSPLMLAGLKEGQVQLLQREADGKVTVSRNETDIVGWTVDEILQNLQGISNPTDSETSEHLERLKHLRSQDNLSAEEQDELESLRHTVSEDLLRGPESGQLDQIVELLQGLNGESLRSSRVSPDSDTESETRV